MGMRTLIVDAVAKRILVAYALPIIFLLAPNANAKHIVTKKSSFSLSPLRKAALLNYPPLPKEISSKIATGRLERSSQIPSGDEARIGRDWPLVNIGFFQAFTALIQPVKASQQLKASAAGCSADVIVAVVDTGIDYTHPGLKNHLWINQGESGPWQPPPGLAAVTSCRDKSCNGIDDDGNGFIDDVVGWDFVNEQPLPYDVHGHGTHIAGIISNNNAESTGMVGVCPGATIMPLKYYDNSGLGYNNLQNTVRAVRYAIKMGANIINYSGGGSDPAASERAAIEEAMRKGILFVAAAGNDGHNNDQVPYYPASYGLENIISVASMNREYELLPSSNYGTKSVNIAAPGLSILSSMPVGKFGTMSGTSQATAFVTGAAALLASQEQKSFEFNFRKIKRWLLDGAKALPGNEKHRIMSGGSLEVAKSLEIERDELNQKMAPISSHSDLALRPQKASSVGGNSKTY